MSIYSSDERKSHLAGPRRWDRRRQSAVVRTDLGLRSLPDFQLFELKPRSGSLVTGFGQAYKLSGERFETISP